MEAPVVNVGIMTEKAVSFVFHGEYVHTETGKFLTGEQRALFVNGNIVYNGRLFKEIFFEPASPSSSFELKAVTIGRNFHWQRQEDQCFKGAFNLVTGENGIVVINQVDVEEYLTSVILPGSQGGRAQAMKRFSLVTVNHLGTSYQSEWSGHRFQVSHSFLFRGWYAA